MKTNILKISIFMAVLFIISSCSKYEEGPGLTLLTKTMRITGIWKIDKMLQNGTEVALDDETGSMQMEMLKDGTGEYTFEFNSVSVSTDLEWELNDDKTILRTRMKNGETWLEWEEQEIIRLSNSEFWLKDSYEEYDLEIRLVKQ